MQYTIFRNLAVAIFTLIPCWVAIAQRLPTDTELRASYCMPVVVNDIGFQRHAIQLIDETLKSEEVQSRILKDPALSRKLQNTQTEMQQYLVDSQSALRRLQLYVLPRMAHLDPTPLRIATKRAEEDLDLIRRKGSVCIPQCITSIDTLKCASECANLGPDLSQRLESCRNLSWLPF